MRGERDGDGGRFGRRRGDAAISVIRGLRKREAGEKGKEHGEEMFSGDAGRSHVELEIININPVAASEQLVDSSLTTQLLIVQMGAIVPHKQGPPWNSRDFEISETSNA